MAVIDGDWVLTLAELNAMVNRYGNVLREAGVRAGEKVLWVGQNSAEVVAINHAARKVGAVCVPMNYRLAPDETQYVIDNCDAVVVLFDIEQVAQLESIRARVRPRAGVVRVPPRGGRRARLGARPRCRGRRRVRRRARPRGRRPRPRARR